MTKFELSRLIKRGERQTVSLKALRGKPSALARPMASFSNTNDGLLIVGNEWGNGNLCMCKGVTPIL